MNDQRILVTGGAGFIGSHLIDRLLDSGKKVMCIDDFNDFYDPAYKRENVAGHLGRSNYELVELDIRDRERMRELAISWRPSLIVHLAARAGVRPSLVDAALYETTNVAGTLAVLDAARHAGVSKLVFGSSSSVYGLNRTVPFAESDPLLHAASPYAATKIAGEALCNAYANIYPLPIVSLRFFTVYGPRQRPDLAIRKFAELMLDGRPIQLFGDGSASRDYTFVDDIVAGVLAAFDHDTKGHQVFNLGNSTPVELADLVSGLERALGTKATIERLPDQPGDVPITFADLTRSTAELGYRPSTPLAAGLDRFVDWLKARRAR